MFDSTFHERDKLDMSSDPIISHQNSLNRLAWMRSSRRRIEKQTFNGVQAAFLSSIIATDDEDTNHKSFAHDVKQYIEEREASNDEIFAYYQNVMDNFCSSSRLEASGKRSRTTAVSSTTMSVSAAKPMPDVLSIVANITKENLLHDKTTILASQEKLLRLLSNLLDILQLYRNRTSMSEYERNYDSKAMSAAYACSLLEALQESIEHDLSKIRDRLSYLDCLD